MMNKPEKKIFVEFCEDRNLRDFSGDIPVVYGKIATAHGGHFIAFGGQDGNGKRIRLGEFATFDQAFGAVDAHTKCFHTVSPFLLVLILSGNSKLIPPPGDKLK